MRIPFYFYELDENKLCNGEETYLGALHSIINKLSKSDEQDDDELEKIYLSLETLFYKKENKLEYNHELCHKPNRTCLVVCRKFLPIARIGQHNLRQQIAPFKDAKMLYSGL